MATRTPYEETGVSVERSKDQIRRLLGDVVIPEIQRGELALERGA